ncbi:MAG: hypothetical protein QOI40_3557, partial [Alphaproteobacteria bacterium]|nr:hypothetical protein [Alphaproteobacteria bacterium]
CAQAKAKKACGQAGADHGISDHRISDRRLDDPADFSNEMTAAGATRLVSYVGRIC